jgi:hypothetical protein
MVKLEFCMELRRYGPETALLITKRKWKYRPVRRSHNLSQGKSAQATECSGSAHLHDHKEEFDGILLAKCSGITVNTSEEQCIKIGQVFVGADCVQS